MVLLLRVVFELRLLIVFSRKSSLNSLVHSSALQALLRIRIVGRVLVRVAQWVVVSIVHDVSALGVRVLLLGLAVHHLELAVVLRWLGVQPRLDVVHLAVLLHLGQHAEPSLGRNQAGYDLLGNVLGRGAEKVL